MAVEKLSAEELEFHPLTPERWDDFEELFGEHGAYGGCWCMYWRITRAKFAENGNEGNRLAMKAIVDSGLVPGILAYHRGRAVGWCSIAPREEYGSLERSPRLKRVDGRPVWSIVCFFMARDYRRRGLMGLLLEAAVDYARERGATAVEGYPISAGAELKGCTGYMGIDKAFAAAGFEEVARPGDRQAVMRRYLA